MTDLIQELLKAVPDLDTEETCGERRVLAPPERIREVLSFVRDHGMRLLVDIGGVDYLDRTPRFEVFYLLRDPETAETVTIKVGVREGEAIPSATAIFKGANWPEREIFDLFGIPFEGHPNLVRILLPEGWEGHPLRRDYPLVGTEPLPPLATE